MVPLPQTPNSYVKTATHRTRGWEFSYHMQNGFVASLSVHQSGDPQYLSVIADYILAVQQSIEHLLVRELLPARLASTKAGIMNQLTNHISLARPELIVQYKLMELAWAEALCVEEAVAIHQVGTVPGAVEQ